MKRVALATCAAWPALYDDDHALIPALAARGVEASAPLWNDARVDWAAFDLVVVRSPWDYHHALDDFLAWIDRVDAATRLVNGRAIVRWNAHKGYLRDLDARGVRSVPTAWVGRGTPCDLAALLDARGWSDVVLKPAVSAGAENTLRLRRDDAARLAEASALLASITSAKDAMLQPYLASVESSGERSLVFFDGAFSHAIRKHALLAPGAVDRMAQGEGVPRVDGAPDELAFAAKVLAATRAATGHDPLYARIDLARGDDGAPLLMELEVIEPCLFLRAGEAHDRFAAALARHLGT